MFTSLQNSLSTRELPQGAAECTFDIDLTRGPANNSFCSLWIGATGDVEVITAGGETVTFLSLQAGTHLPIQVQQVVSGGTTVAANTIVCLY